MTYTELIAKIGKIVEGSKLLLRVNGDTIFIDAEYFTYSHINKLQRLFNLYGECEWWVLASDTLNGGVMYKVNIYLLFVKLNDMEQAQDKNTEPTDEETELLFDIFLVNILAKTRKYTLAFGLSYFIIGFISKAMLDWGLSGIYPFETKNWYYYVVTTEYPKYFEFLIVRWGAWVFLTHLSACILIEIFERKKLKEIQESKTYKQYNK